MIGIVGGIGPMAGADLYEKIVENTVAHCDQDHVPVLVASIPHEISDRTSFLLGQNPTNPAHALADVVLLLERAGAHTIGIACNTAHAAPIFEVMCSDLAARGSRADIVHLIDHTTTSIQAHPAGIQRVGLLCTSGSYRAGVYQKKLEKMGLTPVLLDFERHDEIVQSAIYHPETGLKVTSGAHPAAIERLNQAIVELQALGADAVVLGCTEIGMVEKALDFRGLEVFNPNLVLARALLARAFPEKLKPALE